MSFVSLAVARAFAARAACRWPPSCRRSAGAVEPLVTPQWLKAAPVRSGDRRARHPLGDRWRRRRRPIAKGHIPGAVHSDYDKAGWRVTRNGVPFMLPTRAGAGEADRRDRHRRGQPRRRSCRPACTPPISASAARVYWTLKIAGHPAVSILDGGFAAWQAASYPVESRHEAAVAEDFHGQARQALLAEVGEVEAVENPAARRCSMRGPRASSPARRRRRLRRPMATSRARSTSTARRFYDPATNRLRPKAELAAIARTLPAGPVVSYCNTGHWAATNWFVLSEMLGRTDVTLYDGSMVEWTADAAPAGRLRAHALGRPEEGAGLRLLSDAARIRSAHEP